jgi:hypothetical protein
MELLTSSLSLVNNRPEAATDLHDQNRLKWNLHWNAREESHDDGPCVLAMLNDPAVA